MLDNEVYQNQVISPRGTGSASIASPMDGVNHSIVMPDTPAGGLVVKVAYTGACYSEGQRKRGFRPKLLGKEIAGYVHSISDSLPNCNFTPGDKVILFPDDDVIPESYAEFIAIDNPANVIQIPQDMSLEVAAMLPGAGLTAYSAVLKAKPHIEKIQQNKPCVNVLMVGAGSLGLWSLQLARNFIESINSNSVRIFVADNSIDKLLVAQDHGCYDIIHWNEEDHEQYIVERTLDACRGGVDVIIDFVSSPRTMQRSLKVLNREGLILVGGDSVSEVSISLNALAAKQQSIVGIPQGNLNQLYDLLHSVQDKKITPPSFAVFPVEDANQVYEDLYECRITGQPIFRFGQTNTTSVDNSSY